MASEHINVGGSDHSHSESSDSSHDEHGATAATPSISLLQMGSVGEAASNTVAAGSTSTGKRVLDEKRSRLAPDILDCLLCLKDWEDARLGIQKKSAKDELRDYFSDSDIDGDD